MLEKLKKKLSNVTELRRLLGLFGYFRRAMPNFSQIAKPLYGTLKNSHLTNRSKQPINWTEENQSSLDNLLIHVTSFRILDFPNFLILFILHIDASAKVLGCVLYQNQENQLRVLGYGRMTLVTADNKYSSSKV